MSENLHVPVQADVHACMHDVRSNKIVAVQQNVSNPMGNKETRPRFNRQWPTARDGRLVFI